MVSVMYITVKAGRDNIIRMFWEGEKPSASGPTDNIHKTPS